MINFVELIITDSFPLPDVDEWQNGYICFGVVPECDHFRKLGSPLRCIESYPSIRSQVERYCHLVSRGSAAFWYFQQVLLNFII